MVTQGHRNRHVSIRHLWFPINVPQQPWAYLVPFPRQTAISVKNRKIFPPRIFCVPAEGVLFGIGYRRSGLKKVEWWGYRTEKAVWRYLQPSGYYAPTWPTDGRTERRTDRRTPGDSKDRVYALRRAVISTFSGHQVNLHCCMNLLIIINCVYTVNWRNKLCTRSDRFATGAGVVVESDPRRSSQGEAGAVGIRAAAGRPSGAGQTDTAVKPRCCVRRLQLLNAVIVLLARTIILLLYVWLLFLFNLPVSHACRQTVSTNWSHSDGLYNVNFVSFRTCLPGSVHFVLNFVSLMTFTFVLLGC